MVLRALKLRSKINQARWQVTVKKPFTGTEFTRGEAFDKSERRRHTRYRTEQLSALELGQQSTFVETVGLSEGGAKCRIATGFAPFEGDRVNLRLVDGTWRTGIVRWTEGQAFGIEFDHELPNPQDRLFYEHLGYKRYGDIVRLQKLIHGSD